MRYGFATVAAGLALCTTLSYRVIAAPAPGLTQGGRSTAEPVYTDEQARRGAALYADSCAGCHGTELAGAGVNPPLAGAEFEGYWRGKPVAELFDKVAVTMPKSKPGSLTPAQGADLVAYLLQVLKAPAGPTPLPAAVDALAQITIAASAP